MECGKVISLEKKLKGAKEKMFEAASREAAIQEAMQWVVEEFKQSEEFKTSLDTSYEDGYGEGVEEIFFNIWSKRHEVDFKFLGKEFHTMITDCEDHEKKGELNTNPPYSLLRLQSNLLRPLMKPTT